MAKDKPKGQMTVQEAGRKGGQTTAERYGHKFYVEMGKKGGKKGGQVTYKYHGREFYQQIGRKGGQKVRELIEEVKRLRAQKK